MDFFYNRILQTEDYKQVEQDLISIVKDFSPYDTTLIINITKKLLDSNRYLINHHDVFIPVVGCFLRTFSEDYDTDLLLIVLEFSKKLRFNYGLKIDLNYVIDEYINDWSYLDMDKRIQYLFDNCFAFDLFDLRNIDIKNYIFMLDKKLFPSNIEHYIKKLDFYSQYLSKQSDIKYTIKDAIKNLNLSDLKNFFKKLGNQAIFYQNFSNNLFFVIQSYIDIRPFDIYNVLSKFVVSAVTNAKNKYDIKQIDIKHILYCSTNNLNNESVTQNLKILYLYLYKRGCLEFFMHSNTNNVHIKKYIKFYFTLFSIEMFPVLSPNVLKTLGKIHNLQIDSKKIISRLREKRLRYESYFKNCRNKETLIGDKFYKIPERRWYNYNTDNYCYDICELMTIISNSLMNGLKPRFPWTGVTMTYGDIEMIYYKLQTENIKIPFNLEIVLFGIVRNKISYNKYNLHRKDIYFENIQQITSKRVVSSDEIMIDTQELEFDTYM